MLDFSFIKPHSTINKWLLISAIIFFAIIFSISALWLGYNLTYRFKVYPGIYLSGQDLSGMTPDQVRDVVNTHINFMQQNGIIFRLKNESSKIYPLLASPSTEVADELITYNTEQTINSAMSIGRSKNIISDIKDIIFSKINHKNLKYVINIDNEKIKNSLYEKFNKIESPSKNATLSYDTDSGFFIIPEKSGKSINYDEAINLMKTNLENNIDDEITLSYNDSKPTITKSQASNAVYSAEAIVELAPIKLISSSSTFTITKERLASWLIFQNSDSGVIIDVDQKETLKYLTDTIGEQLNKEAQDAKFTMENGKIVELQSSSDGIKINATATLEKILQNINISTSSNIIIDTIITKSQIVKNNLEDFNIKELIATGQSNFVGSSKNRVRNIKVGANSVNGTLIKPGQEFSLLHTLGKIDESTGYVPELVIKDNKTTPEFGGGLCQIGTTVFRGATNAGLPITQRRNHSYRVGYYEPAGTDATIYDPAPDFRFVNDTNNYILIKSRFEGYKLYFEFWGTKDGRIVKKDQPTIYNIVKPAPGKIIKTLDLKPGVKKCTEKAHNGADAFFNYKVTYASGDVKEKKFYSHYVPWQEVCLLGVTKEEMTKSSSTEIIMDNKTTTTISTSTNKTSTTTTPFATSTKTTTTTSTNATSTKN